MKERPILFSGEMVRAILGGRKTQTRRICKVYEGPYGCRAEDGWPEVCNPYGDWHKEPCPYGMPGDRLWVRESFSPWADGWTKAEMRSADPVIYKADFRPDTDPLVVGGQHRWKPSIHMPRWASRIILEIVDVRVERVQDISDEDARMEGILLRGDQCDYIGVYRDYFHSLWDSINTKRGFGWDANPWVWVIEFKRIEQ